VSRVELQANPAPGLGERVNIRGCRWSFLLRMWRNVCHWAASSLDGCACDLFVPSLSVKLRRAAASEKTNERLGTTKVQAISFLQASPESDTSGLDLFWGRVGTLRCATVASRL